MPKKTKTYFREAFRQCLKEIVGLASTRTLTTSLAPHLQSTVKAAMAGKHIRPASLKAIAEILPRMDALQWAELKTRYCEAYIGDTLASHGVRYEDLDRADTSLRLLFRRRAARTSPLTARLPRFIRQALAEAGRTPASFTVGADGVSSATVRALLAGKQVSFRKFDSLCNALGLPRLQQRVGRILFLEHYLGETILGTRHAIFDHISRRSARSAAVLLLSSSYSRMLA